MVLKKPRWEMGWIRWIDRGKLRVLRRGRWRAEAVKLQAWSGSLGSLGSIDAEGGPWRANRGNRGNQGGREGGGLCSWRRSPK